MNRLITVNSYTTLANIPMIAIATKLLMLIMALLFSQPILRGRSPSSFTAGTQSGLDLASHTSTSGRYRLVALTRSWSEEGVPAMFDGVVSLDLINGFATNRTKPNMNPPMAVPYIAEADT